MQTYGQIKMIKKIFKFIIEYVLSLMLVIRAYTLGIFIKRYRNLIHIISNHSKIPEIFEKKPEPLKYIIRQKEANEIVSCSNIPIVFPAGSTGNVSTLEILILNNMIKEKNPKRILEIGTFDGRTTLNFAVNSSPETDIFTLDLPQDQEINAKLNLEDSDRIYIRKSESGSLFRNYEHPAVKKIIQLYGDSANFNFQGYNNSMDFIFIDGSHHYEYVLKDTETAMKLLRDQKGTIVWHDYLLYWSGVVSALNELYQQHPFNKMRHIEKTSLVYLEL